MSNTQSSIHSINALLHLKNVSVYDGNHALLNQVDLTVTESSFHCLVGESGSGKSLLARTVLNMRHPHLKYQSQIAIDLNNTDAMFQDTNSNFFQNVRIQKHFDALFDALNTQLSRQQQHEFVLRQFRHLGLENPEDLFNDYPFQLSGGMAQRIALVMSIVREAKLLIVDEPTSALDFDNRNQLMKLLNHVVQEHNMTLLFITHDLSLAMDYATHISVMRNGQMIESGEANDILVRPEHAYSQQLIELAHRRYRYVAD